MVPEISWLNKACCLWNELISLQVHLEKEASIPDHCEAFSLSGASNPDCGEKCQHNQEDTCEQCEALNYTLREKNCCHFSSDDERDEAIYIMRSSKLVIRSWQWHILRLFNQDQQWRTKFLGQLTRSALIFPTFPLSPKQSCCSLTLWLSGGYYSSFYKSWTNVENQFVYRTLKAQRWTSIEDPGRCVHHYCKCLLWNTCILMLFSRDRASKAWLLYQSY